MTRLIPPLIVGLVVLAAIGPNLGVLAQRLVPLVIILGVIVAVLRIVWHFTSRY